MDRRTTITCSEGLPLMFKLVDGTYLCQLGQGLHTCKAPEVFKPDSTSLSDQITHSFHKILGIGILTATTIRDLAIRIHEPFYQKVLEAELTTRNIEYRYIAKGAPLKPLPSLNFKEKLADLVGAKISPAFATLGKIYIYIHCFHICDIGHNLQCPRHHHKSILGNKKPWGYNPPHLCLL